MGSCTTLPKSSKYEENVHHNTYESNMDKSGIETDKICTTAPTNTKNVGLLYKPTQQQFNSYNTKSPKPQQSVDKNEVKLIECKLEKQLIEENIELRKELIEAKENNNGTILELQQLKLEHDMLKEQLISIKKEKNDTQLNKQEVYSKQDPINASAAIHETSITVDTPTGDDNIEKQGEQNEFEEAKQTENSSLFITESEMEALLGRGSSLELNNWKDKDGILSIKVLNATNVDNMDEDEGPDGASDLYVVLKLPGNYGTTQTKIIYNDENPAWNERFQLLTENPKTDVLKCTIWDKNKWTFDDKIGDVDINVIDIITKNNGYIEGKGYDVCGSQIGCKLYLDVKYWEGCLSK